jgi:hypothetical protein
MAEGRAECRLESSNDPGYVCNCTDGYQDNPYVIDGYAGVLLPESLASSTVSYSHLIIFDESWLPNNRCG